MERSVFSQVEAPYPLVTPLTTDAFDIARILLSEDIPSNLFMLAWLENYGVAAPGRPELFSWHGVKRHDRLSAVSLVINNRLLLVHAPDENDARFLGSFYSAQPYVLDHIVSDATTVKTLWEAYTRRVPHARLHRDQSFLKLRDNEFERREDLACSLRPASPHDVDAVFLASAHMHAEETLEDPLEKDANLFRRHIEQRVLAGRTFVWFDDIGRLIFKADVSARCSHGAQISGVYTPPSLRGRGIGTRGVTKLCELLFRQRFPLLTLYVNRENGTAQRIYERIGFHHHCDYRTIFVT